MTVVKVRAVPKLTFTGRPSRNPTLHISFARVAVAETS